MALALMDAGADPEAGDRNGNPPVRWLAARDDRRPVAHLLLGLGGPPPDVFLAAARGDAARVRALVDVDPALLAATTTPYDAVASLSRGSLAVHVAAIHGHTEVVALLLDLGAAVDARSVDGATPLHEAAFHGRLAVAELLLARGAPLDARGPRHDSTPLGWAEFRGQSEMVAFLRSR